MLVFRTEASKDIGFGHLTRSAYLASLLRKDIDILFCTNQEKEAIKFLDTRKIPYCLVKDIKALANKPVKSILFDLKTFGSQDIELISWAKQNNKRTVQITDLGLRQQETDFTIDASIEKLIPYPPEKELLSGPAYAILHHKCRHFHQVRRKYRKKVKNILLALAEGIEYRQLRTLIDILSRHRFNLKIALAFYAKKSNQKILKRIYPGIRFVGRTESLARSFFEADLAVITPGISAFEAASVGTPALYLSKNREQEFTAETFDNHGLGLKISSSAGIPEKELLEKINSLSWEQRIVMGARGKELVDARGVYRIIDFFKEKGII